MGAKQTALIAILRDIFTIVLIFVPMYNNTIDEYIFLKDGMLYNYKLVVMSK